MAKEKFIFFHLVTEPNGWCSNWWQAKFTEDGIEFSNVEQYLMYHKAMLFKDSRVAKEILATDDPREIKALGRKVKNYVDSKWSEVRYDVCYRGNKLKFEQNPELKNKLLSTTGEFAECAVRDTIWGIGLSMHDRLRYDKRLWRGQNLLGQILTQLRGDLS